MSTGVQTAVGKFVWHDNVSSDPSKAQAFYNELFGWETENWTGGGTEGEYPMIKAGGQMHGGFGPAQGGAPPHWLGHVRVDDVDETVRRVEAAGGKLLAPAFDIPEVGRMAVIADPQGAALSAFAPKGDMPPSTGTFVWDELYTGDLDAAKSFYREILGWASRDTDMGEMGTYTMFQNAGEADVAGAMLRPEGMQAPPHWMPYIATGDVDATVEKAKKLGANVFVEPKDIPNMGRFAILADPVGAVFGVWKPSGE